MLPLLSGLRVLDLTNERGYLCGRMLADLGADVIKIEPPGGDAGRRIGPFYHDTPDPQKSLFWFAYNTNKRGATLNLHSATGRAVFLQMIEDTDIVVESFDPGYLSELGLGYESLRAVNPALIMVSITPFGQSGPYANYQSCDLVSMAMGGFINLCGDSDSPPVAPVAPQAYVNAGADAAAAAMIAYHHRQITGEGQQVDVSIQESVSLAMYLSIPFWELSHFTLKRYGSSRLLGSNVLSRMVWPCKDGHVCFVIHGGMTGSHTNKSLVNWMAEEGILPDFMKEIVWEKFDLSKVTVDLMDKLNEYISEFFLKHTTSELYQWATKNRAMLYPVSTCEDLLANDQLKDRNFWVTVDHPELNETITYPGPWVASSEIAPSAEARAPLIGENNQEIYGELGIKPDELISLKQSGVI